GAGFFPRRPAPRALGGLAVRLERLCSFEAAIRLHCTRARSGVPRTGPPGRFHFLKACNDASFDIWFINVGCGHFAVPRASGWDQRTPRIRPARPPGGGG